MSMNQNNKKTAMKTYSKYIGMAFAIAALAACSNEDEPATAWQTDPDAVKINATVGNSLFTRSNPLADDTKQTQFNSGDRISIAAGSQSAVAYTYNGTAWTPVQQNQYLKWESNSMDFTAYYPAEEGISAQSFTLPTAQGTEDACPKADYMTFSGSHTPNTGGTVDITMQRKTARVIVAIAAFNSEFTGTPTVTDVKIYSGAASYANSLPTGEPTAITPLVQNQNEGAVQIGTTYTALVIPTEAKSETNFITMNVNGNTLVVKNIPAMTAGNSYTYNLTIGKNALTIGEVTVSAWTGGTINGGEAVVPCTVDAENHTVTLGIAGYLTEAAIKEALGDSVGAWPYKKTEKLKIAGPINDEDMNTLTNYMRTPDNLERPSWGWINALDLDETSGSFAIPESWMYIVNGAPFQNTKLTSVKLGGAVTSVGKSAFESCYSLVELTFGKSVKKIGNWAFSNCKALQSVTIGENVDSIGENAFQSCDKLNTVVIGGKVTTIGTFAFSAIDSENLTFDMTALTTLPTIGKDIFQAGKTSVTVILNDTLYSNLGADGLSELYTKLSNNGSYPSLISVTITNKSGTESYPGN